MAALLPSVMGGFAEFEWCLVEKETEALVLVPWEAVAILVFGIGGRDTLLQKLVSRPQNSRS